MSEETPKKKSIGIYVAIAGVAVASVGLALLAYQRLKSTKSKRRRRHHRPKVIVHEPVTNMRAGMTEVFDSKQVKSIWAEFASHARDQDGISREEFAKILEKLGITDHQIVESTFRSFDTGHTGQIEFLELFNMLSIISSGSRREKLHVMFQMIDTDETGYITFDQLVRMYSATYKAISLRVDPEALREEVSQIFFLAKQNHPGDRITESEFLELAKFEVMNLEEHGGFAEKLLNEFVAHDDSDSEDERDEQQQ